MIIQCKICRLILNFPNYDKEKLMFKGTGFCPQKHYEALVQYAVHEDFNDLSILFEKFFYNEYTITLSHHENISTLYKDNNIVNTVPGILELGNYRDINYIINKLDTMVNFS